MIKKVKFEREPVHLAEVSAFSHDGRGISTINEKKTFIFGALPQEKVTCKLTKKRSSYNEAKALDILQPSSERVVPKCAHFGLCGGCNLQHINTVTQLRLKQQTLLQQLKHFGNITPTELLTPLHQNDFGYRYKARLGVRFVYKKNKLLLGFREKESRYLADIEHCPILHPRVGANLPAIAACINQLSVTEKIAQVEVAIGDEDVALILRNLAPLTELDRQIIIEFAKAHQYHMYLQPNSPEPLEKIWPETPARLHYTLPTYQLNFHFHPLDFTQINLPLNRLMVQQAIHLLDLKPTDKVLDLFCGIGNFTLPMACFAKEVVGIEGQTEMVKRAYENAALNNIQHVHFYAANLHGSLHDEVWMQPYDKVLLDPPRTGAENLMPHFKLFQPQRIVYVSCNTATLARDAQILVHELGYILHKAGIMNMFPHTAHVEAMAVFIKK